MKKQRNINNSKCIGLKKWNLLGTISAGTVYVYNTIKSLKPV